jgi:hypothetical protein
LCFAPPSELLFEPDGEAPDELFVGVEDDDGAGPGTSTGTLSNDTFIVSSTMSFICYNSMLILLNSFN